MKRLIKIANALTALERVSKEQFIMKIKIPKGDEGKNIKEKAISLIGEEHFETDLSYDKKQNQITFAVPDEKKAVELWRKAERALGIKVDMMPEDVKGDGGKTPPSKGTYKDYLKNKKQRGGKPLSKRDWESRYKS